MGGGQAPDFQLLLFTRDVALASDAVHAGVDAVVIDWERFGKQARQADADTEVNEDTLDDLVRMRRAIDARILCRLNAFGPHTLGEIEAAVSAGADELLLPMVRRPEEVEQALELVGERAELGILVETVDAVSRKEEFAALPLSRVFVGLNDLAIERRSQSIFTALVDGTIDEIRSAFGTRFGVGGLTLPEAGHPLPSRLICGELARVRCTFTFLRRSFRRDVSGRSLDVEVPRIREAVTEAFCRSNRQVYEDRNELVRAVLELDDAGSSVIAMHA